MSKLTSAERLRIAFACGEPDRVPILFRAIGPLETTWRDPIERAEWLLAHGADEILGFGAPAPLGPEVEVRRWREDARPHPILHQEYHTPAGTLHASVQITPDWRVDHIPLYSDHAWSRGLDYLVKDPEDLDALDHVLADPRETDLGALRERVASLRREADRLGLLLCGNMYPAPLYALGFLGGERSILAVREERELLGALLERVHRWSRAGLELLLDLGVDVIYRSSCYETVDLFAPQDVREFFMPLLRRDIELCHQAGVPLHSFAQTGVQPFLDDYLEAGLDILSSLDPRGVNRMDLAYVKARVGGRCCLVGGMDNRDPFLRDPPAAMEATVRRLLEEMAPGGGYVLQPAGMIFPEGRVENILAFLDAGRRLGAYPLKL